MADRNALQRQLTSLTAAHEAETRQLHADKTGLQVHRHDAASSHCRSPLACPNGTSALSPSLGIL